MDITGIAELGEAMKRKKIRWAVSAYKRGVEELRKVAGKILRSCLEEDTILRLTKESREKIKKVEILERATEEGVYADRSRIEGQTAVATITQATFLGRYATVMDVEMLTIAMGWEIVDTAITDSQGTIGRIRNLQMECPRG